MNALEKYKIIASYLYQEQTLVAISKTTSVPIRTLKRWVKKYKAGGLENSALIEEVEERLIRY